MDTHDRVGQLNQSPLPRPAQATHEEPITPVKLPSSPIEVFGKIIFFVILLQILLMFGLNLYQKSRLSSLDQQLTDLKGQLSSSTYVALNDQVNNVLAGAQKLQTVLDNKVDWGKFYADLNGVTPKDVRLTTLSVTDNGAFKAEGETKTLSSLAQALVAWQSGSAKAATPFSSLALSSNGFNGDGNNRLVTFSVTGQVNLANIK